MCSVCLLLKPCFYANFQELEAEISGLEKQRDELEAQLKKVCPLQADFVVIYYSL